VVGYHGGAGVEGLDKFFEAVLGFYLYACCFIFGYIAGAYFGFF